MDLEQAIKDLQDSMVITAKVQRLHSEMLLDHARLLRDHDQQVIESQEFRRRIDQNLAEITDKLNGLIGYVAGYRPPPPPS